MSFYLNIVCKTIVCDVGLRCNSNNVRQVCVCVCVCVQYVFWCGGVCQDIVLKFNMGEGVLWQPNINLST